MKLFDTVGELYASGRRLQADRDRHGGLWHQNVYIPALILVALLLLLPTLGLSVLLRSLSGSDNAAAVVIALLSPPGWLLYHLLLGGLEETASS